VLRRGEQLEDARLVIQGVKELRWHGVKQQRKEKIIRN
jgi:hypothetical protein